jgi:hypothetical protein
MFLRVAILATLVSSVATAQTNSFDIVAGGKAIGKDTYTLAKAKQGYKLDTHPTTHFAGSESNTSSEFKYDDNYGFVVGSTANQINQMHTSYTPDKTRTQLVVGVVQADVQNSRFLGIKPNFAIMPSYDAGAAQAMLLLAVTHPTADNLYNVVVPGLERSGPPADPGGGYQAPRQKPGDFAYDALWAKGADTTGSLDGKPVQLHTYTLSAGKSTWTFYADDTNTLMQVDVSLLSASYIRTKFKLDSAQ